jgi:hypothetical protein
LETEEVDPETMYLKSTKDNPYPINKKYWAGFVSSDDDAADENPQKGKEPSRTVSSSEVSITTVNDSMVAQTNKVPIRRGPRDRTRE